MTEEQKRLYFKGIITNWFDGEKTNWAPFSTEVLRNFATAIKAYELDQAQVDWEKFREETK